VSAVGGTEGLSALSADVGPTPVATPPLAVPLQRPPLQRRLYGLGSVYGKTVRDARLATIMVAGLLGLIIVFGAMAMSTEYGTAEARRELAALSTSLPPVMRGIYGNPVNVDTLGGFVTWHYAGYFSLIAGLWAILALSGTLAGEAERGSLDLVASTPLRRSVIALEKVAGCVTALMAAMVIVAVAASAAGSVFATLPGDEVPPAAAAGFAVGLGLKALVAGSVAFALAGFVGRGAAAALAGAIMFGGYIVTSYRAVVPAFDAVAGLSWFAWTADHAPLAGRWAWAPLGFVALASAVLLGIGVAAFVRRDIGASGTTRVPGLPRALLGVGGPVRRAFADVLPASIAWGTGLGLFGLLMAAASRAFADEMARIPTLLEMMESWLPGMDLTTPVGFLELLFVDFGLVLVGLAAVTLVARRMADESSGRFELLLTTPLTRVRWAVANGIGTWLGIAVITGLLAASIAIGVSAAGGEVGAPVAGTLVLALYGMALAGVGSALGGLFGPSVVAPSLAVLAIGTFLVDILGPALTLPDWLQQLALSNHLGEPMLGTWDPAGMLACLALAVGGLAVGAWGLRRRDIG
jgi:ABC-2 type transport system permease protein